MAPLLLSGFLVLAALFSARSLSPCPWPSENRSWETWTSSASCGEPRGGVLRGPARLLFQRRIPIAGAHPRTLEVLPGLGAKRAEDLAQAAREEPFSSLAELERVRGIGPRTVDALGPWLEVGPGKGPNPVDPPVR